MRESHGLVSLSVFLFGYFEIFGIKKVQSYILNEERIEEKASSLWSGSPWCSQILPELICEKNFPSLFTCARNAYVQRTSIFWGEHSQHSFSSLSFEETQTKSTKDLERNGKYKCKIDNSSVTYTNIFVSVSDFQLMDSDYWWNNVRHSKSLCIYSLIACKNKQFLFLLYICLEECLRVIQISHVAC